MAANPKSAAALSGASAANSCPFPTSRWPQTPATHARPDAERRHDRGGGAKWALGAHHFKVMTEIDGRVAGYNAGKMTEGLLDITQEN